MSIEQPTPKTAKHSPAPWVADGNLIRTKGDGNLVTSVYDHLDMDIDAEEAEANISLITAAPELLEALEALLVLLPLNDPRWARTIPAFRHALNAIDKARGR